MGAINNTKREYFTIGGGKLNRGRGNERQQFDTVFGYFTGIAIRKAVVNGEEKKFLDFNFQDGNELFCVSSELYKNNTNQIIQSLVNIPDYNAGQVYISAWGVEKNGINFTNISVRFKKPGDAQPQRLEWAPLPKTQLVTIPETGETVKSNKALREAVDKYIAAIQERFGTAGQGAVEDLPEGDPDFQPQPGFMPEPAQRQQSAPAAPQYPQQQGGYQGPAAPQYPQQPQQQGGYHGQQGQGGYQGAPQYPQQGGYQGGYQGQGAPQYPGNGGYGGGYNGGGYR